MVSVYIDDESNSDDLKLLELFSEEELRNDDSLIEMYSVLKQATMERLIKGYEND